MTQPLPKKRRTDAFTGPTITDSRFANIQSDPRYRLPGKKQKIKLDKRFSRALQDDEFSRKSKVDRYGRILETDSEKKRLKRRYEFEEDEEENGDEPDDDDEVQQELKRVEESRDFLREGRDVSSSEDDSSSEEDDDIQGEASDEPGPGAQKIDVPMGEISPRLAVVNLDWDNIRAQDLMAVFSSFLPPTGRLLNVTIYPSEFGKERMEREEMEGPPKEIFAANEEDVGSGSEEDEDEIKEEMLKPDDGSEFDSTALRQYQLDRLRYFYAVLTFSSAETASKIYEAVDGTEYLSTANFFDLRFIPDETDFSEDRPREECDKLPTGYKPNEFVTDALQHSKVKLTWDAEDGSRKEAQARAFRASRQDIDENDLKAYLGTDSEDESDEEDLDEQPAAETQDKPSKKEAERQRMRALLGLSAEPAKKTKKNKDTPTGDIQITFSSGLNGVADMNDSSDEEATTKKSKKSKRSVFENSPEPEETTMEKYVRKEKERKQRRKDKMKGMSSSAAGEDPSGQAEGNPDQKETDDLGFDDPFFAEPKPDKITATKLRKEERLKKRQEREAEEAASANSRAQLEKLMADDEQDNTTNGKGRTVKHFDMNEIEKMEKNESKKGKYKTKSKKSEALPVTDSFNMNTTDPRFANVFESHEFAIDPTNPRFKGTKGMKALLEEGRKRKTKGESDGVGIGKSKGSKSGNVAVGKGSEVMGLVEKIKRRNK